MSTKKLRKRISLIVINFNGEKLLRDYFDSVFKQSLLPHEVIMIDNASTDSSVKFVGNHYPKVRIIKNKDDFGKRYNVFYERRGSKR